MAEGWSEIKSEIRVRMSYNFPPFSGYQMLLKLATLLKKRDPEFMPIIKIFFNIIGYNFGIRME